MNGTALVALNAFNTLKRTALLESFVCVFNYTLQSTPVVNSLNQTNLLDHLSEWDYPGCTECFGLTKKNRLVRVICS